MMPALFSAYNTYTVFPDWDTILSTSMFQLKSSFSTTSQYPWWWFNPFNIYFVYLNIRIIVTARLIFTKANNHDSFSFDYHPTIVNCEILSTDSWITYYVVYKFIYTIDMVTMMVGAIVCCVQDQRIHCTLLHHLNTSSQWWKSTT